jgi:hypothetical protein
MRYALAALLTLTACAADPVLLPDAGPCNGSCGAGTVCVAGACVSVDSGAADVGSVADAGGAMDVQSAPDVVDVFIATDPAPIADQGFDAGAVDAGAVDAVDVDLRASEVCRAVVTVCDGRGVNVQAGERDGGRYFHCGGCGRTCAAGEGCLNCNCVR